MKKKAANKTKAGKIYLEIAKRALEEWYPRMTEQEREELLRRADYNELELYIGAKNSVKATIKGIDEAVYELWGTHLPDSNKTLQYVLHGIKPSAQLQDIITKLGGANIRQKRFIISCAIHETHDQWVKDNTEEFFDPNRIDRRYMFTRTALIGWKTIEKDLLFIEPVMKGMGLIITDDLKMERCYQSYAKEFRDAVGITQDNLVEIIAKGSAFYPVLDERISECLKNDPIACRSMVLQINRANV